ncbi:MAG: restriction endonuclease subunit S [Burkholderiaceae bacterium]
MPLQDVATVIMGQSPPSSAYNTEGEGLPFFQGKAEFGPLHPTPVKWCSAPTKVAESDDVLMSVRAPVGPTNLATERCCIGRGLAAIRAEPGVRSKWLLYAFRAMERSIDDLGTGTTFKAISGETLRQIEVPVACLEEQDGAIAEIEKQFSRLDEAVASLKRVKANLKRYKVGVLKAAVEGRLLPTEAELARSEGRAFETAAEHLTRVHAARKDGRQGRAGRATRAREVTSELPVLPPGWCWSDFETVADRVTVGHVGPMKDEYVAGGIPFLRSQNVRPNRYDPAGLKFISPTFHSTLRKSALEPGDIVVVRSGSVGVACVIPDSLPVANCSDLVIIKRPRGVLPSFGAYYLNSVVDSRIAAGRVGIALAHFNTQSVAKLPVPVPPLAEQVRIVAEVDRRVSIVREVEAEVDANMTRTNALRSAVLASAFQLQ